jgi:hypothetical protein
MTQGNHYKGDHFPGLSAKVASYLKLHGTKRSNQPPSVIRWAPHICLSYFGGADPEHDGINASDLRTVRSATA